MAGNDVFTMVLTASFAVICTVSSTAERPRRTLAGWVENGWIGSPPVKMKVKLDTGAKTSSIHAAQYRDYQRDGARRVQFTLVNNEGAEVVIDRPVRRTVTIRRAGVEQRDRPVISLKICVAGARKEAEFVMAERSKIRYLGLISAKAS